MADSKKPSSTKKPAKAKAKAAPRKAAPRKAAPRKAAPRKAAAAAAAGPRKGRPRLAIFLLVLGILLAPLTTVAIFAKSQINNTDRYIETVEPLASDPAIQEAVEDFIVTQLFNAVDVPQLAADALPAKAQFLAAPLAQGVRTLTANVVQRFLDSPEFVKLWNAANRAAHEKIVSALTGETTTGNKAVTVKNDVVTLNLGPVITEASKRLGAGDLSIFDKVEIPIASKEFKILDASSLVPIRTGVSFLGTLAWVLPLLMILAFIGAALLARDRRRGTIRSGVTITVTAGAIVVLLNIGRTLFTNVLAGNSLSSDASTALYDTVLRFVRGSLLAVMAIGLIIAFSGWVSGPAGAAVRLRATLRNGISGVRTQAEQSGWKPGPTALFIGEHLAVLRGAVIGVAFLLLLFVGRTALGSVALIVIIALVALGALEFMGRATDTKSVKTPRSK